MKKTSFLEDLKKEGVGKNRKSSGWVGGVVEGNSLSSKCQESSCILGKDYWPWRWMLFAWRHRYNVKDAEEQDQGGQSFFF